MTTAFIIAQAVGLVAALLFIIGMQMQHKKQILLLMLASYSLFSISMFLLGAFSGGVMDIVGLFVTIVVYFYEKKDRPISKLAVFLLAVISVAVWSFTYNAPIDIVVIVASLLYLFSLIQKNENRIRIIIIFNLIAWIIYDIAFQAYPPIISNVISIISAIVAFERFSKKPAKKREHKSKKPTRYRAH